MSIPNPQTKQKLPPTLLGDQPARDTPAPGATTEDEGSKDPLGFDQIADRLANVVLASRGSTPFTLGIEGGWGAGKSTLMLRLRDRLDPPPPERPTRTLLRRLVERLGVARGKRPDNPQRVTTVWFNAWTADERGVLEGLIKSVLNQLDPNILRRSLRDEKLMTWLRFIAGVVASWLRLGNVVDDFWKRVAVDPRARNELQALMTKAMDEWRGPNGRVPDDQLLCVFVDDLDRCSPAGVFEVFEAIKLYLDVEGLVFVVGFDPDIVSEVILSEKRYGKAVTSRDYLEKIVQIAYRIPRAGREEAAAFLDACLEQSHNQELFPEGRGERALVLERNERNPRRIKRFLNGYVVAYGLNPEWAEFSRENLVRVHLLDMYFPSFARLLDRPGHRDPVEEVLTFRSARDALRQRVEQGKDGWDLVVKAFDGYGIKPSTDASPLLLNRLEEYVLPPLAELATQEEFVSLVETLTASEDWNRLRKRMAEGRVRPPPPAAAGTPVFEPPQVDLADLEVLWIDDQRGDNRPLVEAMIELGANVTLARDAPGALELLAGDARIDVLLLELSRADQPDAGMSDLEQLRSAGVAPPRAVFFTSHATAAQEARASGLGASITSDPHALFETLARPEPMIDPAIALREAEARGDPDAAAELVKLLSLRDDWHGAADVLRRSEDRGSATASADLGNLLLQYSQTEKAEAAFRRAADSGDPAAVALGAIGLAGVLIDRNDIAGARSAYQQAIDAGHPDHVRRAEGLLERLLAEQGETDGARLADRHPTAPEHTDEAPEVSTADGHDDVLMRFRPVLRYDSIEQFFADSAAQWTECPGNELRRKDLAGVKKGKVIASAVPVAGEPKLTLAFLGPKAYGNGEPIKNGDIIGHPGRDYRDSYVRLRTEHPELNNRMYGRAVMHNDRLWLQYWFWYFYNDYQLAFGAGTHEGDWEMIQLRMHPTEDRPDVAVYRQHRYGERRLWLGVEKVGDRPIVYVARGSHASYFEAGFHQTKEWYDLADGKRAAPELTLELIRPDTHAWMLWNGRWGDPGSDEGSSSPTSPGRRKEWTRPGDMLDAARRETTLAGTHAAPAVRLARDGGMLRIDYNFTQYDPRPISLVVSVDSRDEKGIPPRTRNVGDFDPSGCGSVSTDIPLDPAKHYDVYTSTVAGDPPEPSESVLGLIDPVRKDPPTPLATTTATAFSKLFAKIRGS